MSSLDVPVAAKRAASQTTPSKPRRSLSTRWISALTLATLLLVWWAVTAAEWIEPLFLPSPEAVLSKAWLLLTQGYMESTLWQHLGASLQRIGLALAAAIVTAIPIGIAIGHNRIARGILDPLIEFYRPIPPLAYLPLIVIWCGIGELSKVLLIYLAIFAPIAIATATGVRTVDPTKLRAAQSLGATRWQLIRHVILPSALPDILTGVRIGLGVGWSTLVAAELIAATSGLGFMVQSAAQFLVTDVVVLGILVIALIAFALEMGLRALQRKLVPWHGQSH
ncbi:taurine ABC transporter permease TauC [Pseudomonas wadenswilerensis]|jgi:taurine transport system permease protein|uniref:Taurine transport system permease protein TauC n=1 Tax=Pseudomonas wadenswilerensis TaxID=1785161 RepID=A0A380SUI3_9PSED|nr:MULTISPECIES: taurine ABC transporter permease TauC [Pseudomonas]MCE5982890.1 taurine ABC transporter permease TauC [Pseudomonas sp. LF19]UVM21727.1 taurine ABC transporter permease TauC [Pseudomonas wadenswilerensis]SPO69355.1 taurine transporter subunit; membrane component of ABC superfamily [Pseudomonas sp. JV241A]SUQ60970.1 Taurine transport system permease protein TauC [Pseudomonas wadenswilerensis]